jgi:hypothetical protein
MRLRWIIIENNIFFSFLFIHNNNNL